MRTLLLSTICLGLLAAPAFAQGGQPGERLINDNRVPEAPQLDNPIFEKPKTLTKKQLEEAPEPPSTDAHRDVHGNDDAATSENGSDNNSGGNVNLNVDVDTDRAGYDPDDVAEDIEDLQDELDDAEIDGNVDVDVNEDRDDDYYDRGNIRRID